MIDKPIRLYVLTDPRTSKVKYVGATRMTLKARARCHRSNARQGRPAPVCVWVRELLSLGLRPNITLIVETADPSLEKTWTLGYKAEGEDLLNVCNMRERQPKAPRVMRPSRGEKNGQARLSEAQVLEIRASYPTQSMYKLAAKYGVSAMQIHHIVRRKRWAHVPVQTIAPFNQEGAA